MRYFYQTISTLLLAIFILSGCSSKETRPAKIVINTSLPTPTINGALSDTKAIAFEWQKITDERVKGLYIYRNNPLEEQSKLKRIATIDGTIVTHYVDQGLEPSTTYLYRFSTFDKNLYESKASKTVEASTLKLPEKVSFFTATQTLAKSAKLIWRPHTDLRINGYMIERYNSRDEEYKIIETLEGRLNAEYIDDDLEDGTIYRYRVTAVGYDDIQSKPSRESVVSTKPLPRTPLNLKISKNLVKKIDLVWNASSSPDIAYYKIYRSYDGGGFSYHAKVGSTTFTDKVEVDGGRYCYRVSAVSKDELESRHTPDLCSQSLAPPKAPTLQNIPQLDSKAELRWSPNDNRAVSYIVNKTTKIDWLNSKTAQLHDIKESSFTDINVIPERRYSYEVIAVDKNGLKSEPSNSQTLFIKGR